MSAVIDMRVWGRANDASFDNTAALASALARRDKGEPLEAFFPAGDWHFSGPLPVEGNADFDNVTISGVFSGPSVQHQEEGGGGSQKDRTRLIIAMNDKTHIWWNHTRSYRYGPLAFRDLTFKLSNLGSLFAFGDPASINHAAHTLRGLTFQRCYLSSQFQYGSANVGDGRPWLIDAPGGQGWVLNRNNESFGLRLHNCYDVTLDLYLRGFKYGVINHHGDRVRGRLRGFILGKLLDEHEIVVPPPAQPAPAPVGAHWQTLYAEAVALAGAVVNGQVDQFRCEWGYVDTFEPDTGPRDLPAEITWTLGPNGDRLVFAFPPGWDYTCEDYFEPRMPVRFTPTNQAEPPRWLFVTGVAGTQGNELLFADHNSKSYVGRPFSGDGSGVLRPFGTGIVLNGDRASVMDPSIGQNVPHKWNAPGMFIRPAKKPIKVGGNAEGTGHNPADFSNLPVVIASSVGEQFSLQGGVDFLGSADMPDHPLVNPGGVGPRFDANLREAQWDPQAEKLRFRPGRGVSSHQFLAKKLTFHWFADPEGYLGFLPAAPPSVNDVAPTARSFKISGSYAPSNAQYLAGRSILFAGGALAGRVASVLNYEDAGGPTITVHGLPAAPANGDPFHVIGPPTACYRLGDGGGQGWELRHVRAAGVETECKIRAYVPSGTPTLQVYGGQGSPLPFPLVAGWQTVVARLKVVQIAGDPGPFVRLTQTGGDVYVSWVEVDQKPPVYAGVYTPPLTNVANLQSSQPYECRFLRSGDNVMVSGRVDVDPNAVNTTTLLGINLPIPSALTADENCSGNAIAVIAATNQSEGGIILADATNNRAELQFIPRSTGLHAMWFNFTYGIK